MKKEEKIKENKIKKRNKNKELNKESKKKKSKLKTFLKILVVLLIIFIILVGAAYWYINNTFNKIQQVEINTENLGISEEVEVNLEKYRNIIIYGVDEHTTNLEDGNSDSIILVTLNEETNEVQLTSIYRDTYVEIEGYGFRKLTEAYELGGPELSLKTINTNFDLNVTEFVTVNFEILKEFINYIGGVELEINSEEANYITGIYKPGTYILTGEQALTYSRIRYTEGGDYTRTERMRKVVEASFNKVSQYNVVELNNLINYLLPKVHTNTQLTDILELLPIVTEVTITESKGWPYEIDEILLQAWYSVPVTLESNVIDLHKTVFGNVNYIPSSKVLEISEEIIRITGFTN